MIKSMKAKQSQRDKETSERIDQLTFDLGEKARDIERYQVLCEKLSAEKLEQGSRCLKLEKEKKDLERKIERLLQTREQVVSQNVYKSGHCINIQQLNLGAGVGQMDQIQRAIQGSLGQARLASESGPVNTQENNDFFLIKQKYRDLPLSKTYEEKAKVTQNENEFRSKNPNNPAFKPLN